MMRNIALITGLLILLSCSGYGRQAGWYFPGSSTTTQNLRSIKALDASTAVAIGDNGAIVRTTNGGSAWSTVSSGTTATLMALHFVNSTTGWAVGYDRTVRKTTDGGATWTSQFSTMSSRNSHAVFFIDGLTGWMTARDDWPGYMALLYKTTNGGTSWSSSQTGTSSNLYSLWFTSSSTGFFAGSGGVLRKTTDGGSSWTTKGSGTSNALYALVFVDQQTGYAVGAGGVIIKTTDAGENWSPLTTGTTRTLYGISFSGPMNGWAVGANGTVISTTDGGLSWLSQSSGTTETLYGTHFTDSQKGWVCGAAGKILKTTSGGSITNDVGVTALDVIDVANPGEAVTVSVTLKNFGAASQSGFPVSYSVNNGTPVVEAYAGTLQAGATGTKTFTTTWSSNTDGEYVFSARSQLSGDENTTNDEVASTKTVVVISPTPPPADPAGWFSQSTAAGVINYNDIYSFNAARAIAVGAGGTIMRTSDGGSTWEKITSGVSSALRGISFFGSQTGWIVGDNGTMLKTTNGGTSWSPMNSGSTKALSKVQFVDATTGWVIENNHNLRRTTDGGSTWQAKYEDTGNAALEDMWFVSPTSGVIVGRFLGGLSIHRTTDAGETWSDPTMYNAWVKDVHFLDALNGWAAGITGVFSYTTDVWGSAYWSVSSASSTFWRTTDGGVTWSVGTISSTAWLNGVRFADATTGWMFDSQKRILRTTDRGSSWSILSGVTANTMISVVYSSTSTVWIVGENNTILRTSDGGVSWASKVNVTTTDWLKSVTFVDDQRGWVTGYSGTIMRTDNGGRTWSLASSGTANSLNASTFPTTQHGWVVGSSGTILRSTDGGASWTSQTSSTTASLNSVFFASNALSGWCVGSSGMILRTTNGGSTWTQSQTAVDLSGLSFFNDQTGWAVGYGGTILKTTDGGQSWVPQSSGSAKALAAVFFVDSQTGWAVGASGEVLKTTNGGTTWSRQQSRTDRYLYSVHFGSASVGWIAGDGVLLKTTNGGATWGTQTSGISGFLSSVCARSATLAWAVGTNGSIIKTSDGGGTISIVPLTPVCISPTDQLTKVSRNVTLVWSRSAEATSFKLQVSKSSSFSSNVVDQSSLADTTYVVTGLDYGTKYYWRVSASSAGGNAPWSGAWSFTTALAPPAAPSLSSPPNGATDQQAIITFAWLSAAGASAYRLQVSKDAAFTSPVFLDTTISNSAFTCGSLEEGVTYYWRVKARNADAEGDWSGVWSFSTKMTVGPSVPMLCSPQHGTTGLSADLSFCWNRSPGANSYRLQISTASDFSLMTLNQSVADTVVSVTGLASGTTFYWRVNATNMSGSSAWSNVWRFTVGSMPGSVPATPSLLLPVNSASSVSVSPTFTWNVASQATWYRLQVSTAVTFQSLVFDDSTLTATEKAIGGLEKNKTYYWRVRAKNSRGSGDWSPVWSFTTLLAGAAAPTLVTPSQSTTGVGNSLTFRWMKSSEAVSYKFQLSLSSVFTSTLVDFALTDTSYTVSTLASSSTYYWRVQATDNAGLANWSSTWSFSTAGSGWKSSTISGSYRSICFVGNRLGWMAGNSGISATTDGGATWNAQGSGISMLRSICFVDANVGWAAGSNGVILKTTNGGLQWFAQTSGVTNELRGVSMSDANNGWAVAENTILRTTNGGDSWTSQIAPKLQYIYGVKALSNSKGIVYGGSLLLRTTDGGAVWSSERLPDYGFLQGCWFIDANTGWVVGADGVMFKTTNGGAEWVRVHSGTDRWITSIHFVDAQQGWAAGWNGLVLRTTDGGASWGRQISGATSSLYGLYFFDALNGWVVGGQNIKTTDGGGVAFYPPVLRSPALNAMSAAIRPTFEWEPSAGAVSYQLQVATGSSFYSFQMVVNDSALTSTARQTVSLDPNRTYYWRVLAYLGDGSAMCTPTWTFRTGSSATPVEDRADQPHKFTLGQNYPNPFNPSTTIQFEVASTGYVTLKIYSMLGNEVETLIASALSPGRYAVKWNASNRSSGVYYCRMQAGEFVTTRKLLLLK